MRIEMKKPNGMILTNKHCNATSNSERQTGTFHKKWEKNWCKQLGSFAKPNPVSESPASVLDLVGEGRGKAPSDIYSFMT